tara:strand:- start:160 stop:1038 length:879 start_codon:yes stop_codon:yes gene_type:complete
MGIFDAISNIAEMAVDPLVALVTGGPTSAVATVGRPPERTPILERNEAMIYTQEGSSARSFQGPQAQNIISRSAGGGFFGNLGQTIGSFGRDVGGFVQDIAPALNLFGVGSGIQRTNSGTATTIINQRPDESASSGEILGANLGLGSNLIQAATRFARSPAGGTAIGFGAGALGAALGGGADGKPRITRRMKSDVRRIYNMSMGNPDITAQILNQMGTYPRIQFDAATVFFILTKRFRNDGPVVTKAAVRKTKSTLRRMKGVVDMYNSVCKPTTRRAPMRRAAPKAVQLIKN